MKSPLLGHELICAGGIPGRMTTNTDGVNPQGAMLSIAACQSSRTDGHACGAPPGQTGYCFWHDATRREEMLEASTKGGSHRTVPLPAAKPLGSDEARGVLASVLAALLQGSLDPTTARAAAYLVQVERSVAEKEELEHRIAGLEEVLAGRNGAGSNAL